VTDEALQRIDALGKLADAETIGARHLKRRATGGTIYAECHQPGASNENRGNGRGAYFLHVV
jgi:hypothetical protein